MKKNLLVIGGASVLAGALFFILEKRGFHVTFVGFTNRALGPHAVFLLHAPEGVRRGHYYGASWGLREVLCKEEAVWKSWIPSTRVPHPHEFALHEVSSNLFATVSVAQTNAPSRIVFELQEERRGLSEHMWKLWVRLTEWDSQKKAFYLKYPRTRVYHMTNEISVLSQTEG